MKIKTGKGSVTLVVLLAIWSVSAIASLPGLAVSPILGDLNKVFFSTGGGEAVEGEQKEVGAMDAAAMMRYASKVIIVPGYGMAVAQAQHALREMADQLKAEGRFQEIQKTIKALKKEHELNIPKDLAYVEGKLFEDYIHDMKLTQQFAMLNRKAMVDVIMTGMGFTAVETFTTIHNYIDTDAMILRKGSVSAKAGEKLLIPINMRDGSLICSGKGNEDWNCSAPHGAGRLMSRKAAFNALSMEEFQKEMEGIYTTCVVPDTLDESPMAYKSMEEIVAQIGPTAEIIERIRPVYNFKAAD